MAGGSRGVVVHATSMELITCRFGPVALPRCDVPGRLAIVPVANGFHDKVSRI